MAKIVSNDIPIYHPLDDSFINDPNSMRFRFASREDVLRNNLDCSCDAMETIYGSQVSHSKKKTRSLRVKYENTTNPVRERTIPKSKNKKYPTKPKDNSKIQKMKAKSDKFGLL